MYGLAHLFYFNLIILHYYAYVDDVILVHLYIFEFASIGLALVCFTLTKGTGVPMDCVL